MSDLIFDVFFDFFAVFELESFVYFFCSTVLNHAAKKSVGPKMAVFRPFPSGKKVKEKKVTRTTPLLLAVLGVRQEVPSRFKGMHIVFYHPFQRPRPLPYPHTGLFHTKIVIAQRSECLVVNLEEALSHPF